MQTGVQLRKTTLKPFPFPKTKPKPSQSQVAKLSAFSEANPAVFESLALFLCVQKRLQLEKQCPLGLFSVPRISFSESFRCCLPRTGFTVCCALFLKRFPSFEFAKYFCFLARRWRHTTSPTWRCCPQNLCPNTSPAPSVPSERLIRFGSASCTASHPVALPKLPKMPTRSRLLATYKYFTTAVG